MRSQEESRWWIFAVVIAVLALALTGILGYLKVRGKEYGQGERLTIIIHLTLSVYNHKCVVITERTKAE